jgi:hypothetical protein
LTVGSVTVYVTSEASENFTAGSANVTFTVNDVPPVVTPVDPGLSIAHVDDVVVGSDVVISISALDNFTGSVKVLIGDKEIGSTDVNDGSGSFTIPASNLTVGSVTVYVTSEASENFTAGIANVTFTVNDASPVVTPVSPGLGIEPIANVEQGKDVLIIITANENFTGNVDVKVGNFNTSAFIENGKGNATVSTTGFSVGPTIVKVTSIANGNFTAETTNATFNVTAKQESGQNGSGGKDNTPSKPVTVPAKIVAKDLKAYYNKVSYSVKVYGTDGKLAKNVMVVFKINGKKVGSVKTNAKGVATIKLKQLPKKYKITSQALGKSVTKKLTVKQVLTLKTVKVKRSAKKLVIRATLKEGKKALKGKKITFKFNGKKYTAKTNKKGIAKVTIKKKVLKKLKVGKKVKYQATYIKDTVKKTAKVKK